MKNLNSIILVSLVLAVVMGCSLLGSSEKAEKAVDDFSRKYNSMDFQGIYKDADPKFKEITSEAELVEILETVQRSLGKMATTNRTSWKSSASDGGAIVTLDYDVEFAKGSGTASFAFTVEDDVAKLLRFEIKSPLLK